MTNNPTIDGVVLLPCSFCACQVTLLSGSEDYRVVGSHLKTCPFLDIDVVVDSRTAWNTRALLDADHSGDADEKVSLREHCKQCAEIVKTWPEWKQESLGGAPAGERQEHYGFASVLIDNFRFAIDNGKQPTFSKGDLIWFIEQLSKAQSESSGLQSTIAQLEDKLSKAINLDFQRRETIARLEARIAELESGRGEPVANCFERRNGEGVWVNDAKAWADGSPCAGILKECEKYPELYRIRLAYTAPSAPVAVPVDLRKRLNDVWLFLDGQTELNGCVWGEKPEGRHNFWWRKELRAVIEDVNACLDATAALNGVKS